MGRRGATCLLSLVVLAGCAGGPLGRSLTYAQVQTLNPGVSAAWIVSEYPFGTVQRGPDHRIRHIRYPVTDPAGTARHVDLFFDEHEVLRERRYAGPLVRPAAEP